MSVGTDVQMDYGGRRLAGGSTVEWYTPPRVLDALGLEYDLDPAAPAGGVPWIPAARHYSFADDGLTAEWDGRIWLNPPYGREAALWVDRLIEHGDGVALVFARVDAAWAQRALHAADAVCLIAGRLSFVRGGDQDGHDRRGVECAAAVMSCGLGLSFRPAPKGQEARA